MVDLRYEVIVKLFRILTSVFFREVTVLGAEKIPATGAVILVAAPHANQFVDPMILTRSCGDRRIKFLMAAVSLKRWLIGMFGRAMRCIPVERSIDVSKKGTGKILVATPLAVKGVGTKFTEECCGERMNVYVKVGLEIYAAPIKQVISDNELELVRPFDIHFTNPCEQLAFSIGPNIDQSDLYNAVFQVLGSSGIVAIFPEGGSHDRTSLLPLKAGVAIMALGAMFRNPLLEVTIVPVGLNYFNPDKFRSRAVVEFGKAVKISPELVRMFGSNSDARREACTQLLDSIKLNLQAVTVNSPDYESMQLVNMAKDLYKSSSQKYSRSEELELARRFANGMHAKGHEPAVASLRSRMLEYRGLLKAAGLKDHQVKTTAITRVKLIGSIAFHTIRLALCSVLLIPFLTLMSPYLFIVDWIARKKAKQALAASSVKVRAKDVIATWKIMGGAILFPVFDLSTSLVVSSFFWIRGFLPLFFLVIPSLSYLAVIAFEVISASLRVLRPMLWALFKPDSAFFLRSIRHNLRKDIIDAVDQFGPHVIADFQDKRIVRSRRLSSAHTVKTDTAAPEARTLVVEDRPASRTSNLSSTISEDIFAFDTEELDLNFARL